MSCTHRVKFLQAKTLGHQRKGKKSCIEGPEYQRGKSRQADYLNIYNFKGSDVSDLTLFCEY